MIRNLIEKYEKQTQRILEIFPGALAWSIIIFPIWGAFLVPHIVAYVVIAFVVFWFYQSFKAAFLGIKGFQKIKEYESTDWEKEYQKFKGKKDLKWEDVLNVIIIPAANEKVGKLRKTLNFLTKQEISPQQLAVVLSLEKKFPGFKEKGKLLQKEFRDKFGYFGVTYHPSNLPGEIAGKAANELWGAHFAKKNFLKKGLKLKNLTLTSCDADAIFHPKYFSCLTFKFLTNPLRYRRFWQSPITWYNNLWNVPAFIRIVGILGNIIHIADIGEPSKLFFNYSSYSASFLMVDKVGYWDPDVISEDWHLFLKSFFKLKGEVEVEPIFLPTSIDAPEAVTYIGSLINRYEQCKRHAWGAIDIPYAVKEFFRHPEIPFLTRALRVFKLVESHMIWSTNWFLLSLGATLPVFLNPAFGQTVLGRNLPYLSRIILTTCLLALAVIVILDTLLRPPRPKGVAWWAVPASYFQWILMPIATLFMSVLPGLDAHTRLMFGKYLRYRVTEKV